MWDRTNQRIRGMYVGAYEYDGIVRRSRVKLGGEVQHTVDLLDPIQVHGETRHAILVDESEPFFVIQELN
jgi:hypothetical protein